MGGLIRRNDPWALAAFVVWLLLLAMGLLPERTFEYLRELGGVVTQLAWVNNALVITLGLAGYVAYFAWARCTESSVSTARAQAAAAQVGLIAFVAFMPIKLEDLYLAAASPDAGLRLQLMVIIWTLGLAKAGAWFYILSLLFRYYLLHNYRVFADVPSLFPSGRRKNEERYAEPDSVYDPTSE